MQLAPALIGGDRCAVPGDLLRVGVPPVGRDSQAVEVEAEADLDVAGYSHDGALVLPPERGAGVAPDGKVLVPGIRVCEVVEQIDHRLSHLHLALPPDPFPHLPRRLALELKKYGVCLLRPAVEGRSHIGMLSTATDTPRRREHGAVTPELEARQPKRPASASAA